MLRAIDVTAEGDALLLQFAVRRKGEHLEASTIGENGTIPTVELVQATGSLNDVHAGTQIQVIGVAQNNLSLHLFLHLVHVHCLDGTYSAHRHKDGGKYVAVIGLNDTGTGFSVWICGLNLKFHNKLMRPKKRGE